MKFFVIIINACFHPENAPQSSWTLIKFPEIRFAQKELFLFFIKKTFTSYLFLHIFMWREEISCQGMKFWKVAWRGKNILFCIFARSWGNIQTFEVCSIEISRINWTSRIPTEKPRRSYQRFWKIHFFYRTCIFINGWIRGHNPAQ
jgi:hypothetical protein